MSAILIGVHVVVCVALILIVLLQTGKGADIGAAFGAGSSQTLFGSQGPGTFLSKITAVAAVIFMLTALGLNVFPHQRGGGSINVDKIKAPAAQQEPAVPQAPAATDTGATTDTGAATDTGSKTEGE